MARRKSLRAWIRENRAAIDAAIARVYPGAKRNDDVRRHWVLNDEGLHQWARSECDVAG